MGCRRFCLWCTVQRIHTTLAGYHAQLCFRKETLTYPHETDILTSYNVVMKGNDNQLPNISSFIPYSGSLPSYFPCISSISYHHHKPSTLQSSFHLPILLFHCQFLFPGLLLAVLSFFLTCHDRRISIIFSSLACY